MLIGKSKVVLSRLMGRALQISGASAALAENTERSLDQVLEVDVDSRNAAEAIGEISDNLSMVSAAAEEFSINMQQILESVRDSQANVSAVSDSTGELATASGEIAQNTERARSVSTQAVRSVDATLEKVTGLEDAAHEISNLTQVIHDISEQTKVLALNATIEAAREAEAGRGFAVVAREVKDLASETREATAFIRERVSTIEETITSTIAAIKDVSKVIGSVNEVVNTIAAAAEEQSITTRNIADNADHASENFAAISNAVDEGAMATQDVTRRLAQAAGQARHAREASQRCADNSRQIASDATSNFAQTLEINARQDDMISEFEALRVSADVDVQSQKSQLFEFTPRFSVLVADMDADHQRIFQFINEIHEHAKSGASIYQQAEKFREMAVFTAEHFRREEILMEKNGYPKLQEQKDAHTKLLASVDVYANTLESGDPINLVAALNFLNKWLQGHILGEDRQYGDYFKAQGIKV